MLKADISVHPPTSTISGFEDRHNPQSITTCLTSARECSNFCQQQNCWSMYMYVFVVYLTTQLVLQAKYYSIHRNREDTVIMLTAVNILTRTIMIVFCCCSTVHLDKYQFFWPTNAHFINIKMLKFTIKTLGGVQLYVYFVVTSTDLLVIGWFALQVWA
jgi:hypothetical protein